MRSLVHTRVERQVTNVLGSSAILSILVGVVITVMVPSSPITTSLLVPLGAAGLLRVEQALPVTIGANIGTTVTALGVSGPNAVFWSTDRSGPSAVQFDGHAALGRGIVLRCASALVIHGSSLPVVFQTNVVRS